MSGLSLLRTDKMDEAELARQANAVAGAKPGETVHGVALCSAEAIRGIYDSSDRRSLCVKDDPVKDDPKLPNNPAHAVLIQAARGREEDPTEAMRLRGILIDLFSGSTPIANVYK
jgi:hypothetical protein